MKRWLWHACLLLGGAAAAGADEVPDQVVLEVGLRLTAPFVMQADELSSAVDAPPQYSGLALELWEEIAAENGWRYRYRPLPLSDLFDQLERGEIDLAVGGLSITEAREQRVDFSHPFLSDGLGIAVKAEPGLSLGGLARRLWQGGFLLWVFGLVAMLGVVGVFAWLLERRGNAGQFGGTPAQGIGSGFWWAAVTMSTVGYGDKAPATLGGRLLALVWMFTAIILVAVFTAGITASLTVGALESRVQGIDDLPQVRVATVNASTADQWLQEQGIRRLTVDGSAAALQLLATGEVDAVVGDAAALRFQIRHQRVGQGLHVLPQRLDRQQYALALAPGHAARREALNRSLLRTLESPQWQARLNALLGEGG
ncbi:transporter substrate-binding domain-containing protein [Pseudomarimonas arenosa]|uniref:Transporter substrate-binding domain-containing protein n=1 Tax=Pseudomarimonas arenosa TaxID=2774145 RepID=A0AAW3ZNV1_9GAMM|nr:transporter substrate-binding domain-containing protein [Pseudomarimonas arenosa]MBD8526854.1 transporter substrate-binding domain-containing protein [Pseudomarimonas arenosa]